MLRIIEDGNRRYLQLSLPGKEKSSPSSFRLPLLASLKSRIFWPVVLIASALTLATLLFLVVRVFENVTTVPVIADTFPQPLPPNKATAEKVVEAEKHAGFKLQLKDLLFELKAGSKATEQYKITPIPLPEVLQGQKGDYFYVTLVDPKNKAPFYFKPGNYTLDELDIRFGESLSTFHKEVMKIMQKADAKIFVQGSADSLGAKSLFSPIHAFGCNEEAFNKVTYHPRSVNETYRFANATLIKQIGEMVTNSDLPFLRAKFLQCKYQSLYPESVVSILEGSIDPSVSEFSRNGTFILYVPVFK